MPVSKVGKKKKKKKKEFGCKGCVQCPTFKLLLLLLLLLFFANQERQASSQPDGRTNMRDYIDSSVTHMDQKSISKLYLTACDITVSTSYLYFLRLVARGFSPGIPVYSPTLSVNGFRQ